MHQLRFVTALILFTPAIFAGSVGAKAPTDTSTVCDRYQRADVVFTGSPESPWITMVDTRTAPPIRKRAEKPRRVRFLVREWYKGERRNLVDVWMTPGDCALPIQPDQAYLVYAHVGKDAKDKARFESNACMGTVAINTAASDISYLTAAQLGPANATHITGNAGGPGVNVTAKSGVNVRYAVSDNSGMFTFDGLSAGDWQLSMTGVTKPLQLGPSSCVDLK